MNFSVYNPADAELSLHGKINDRLHRQNSQGFEDRFHQQFILHFGWNDLRISLDAVRTSPAGREMNMHEIEGFGIFVVRQARPLVIYIDNVFLSK